MKLFANLTILIFILLLITCSVTIAQNLDEKLDEVKGDIDKITITAGGKEYTFEGNDAEKIFNRIKLESFSHSFTWSDSDDDNGKNKVFIVQSDGDGEEFEIVKKVGKNLSIISSDDEDGIKKKIEVEVENGDKKVTVTTNENGEEKTEVYEGDEAEKFLDEMEANHDCEIEMHLGDDCAHHKGTKKIIIEKKTEKENEKESE